LIARGIGTDRPDELLLAETALRDRAFERLMIECAKRALERIHIVNLRGHSSVARSEAEILHDVVHCSPAHHAFEHLFADAHRARHFLRDGHACLRPAHAHGIAIFALIFLDGNLVAADRGDRRVRCGAEDVAHSPKDERQCQRSHKKGRNPRLAVFP